MPKRALLVFGLLSVAGCRWEIFPDFSDMTGPPVAVDIWFWGSVLEVGSISRVCAAGAPAPGYIFTTGSVEAWTLSDPTLARLEPMPAEWERTQCTLLRVLRPGELAVTAHMAGLTGSSTIRLIPTIGAIVLSPSVIQVVDSGDTAGVRAAVLATNGDTIPDVPLSWGTVDYAVAGVVFYGSVLGDHAVVKAHGSGRTSVYVYALASRFDSTTAVRGNAAVVVGPSGVP